MRSLLKSPFSLIESLEYSVDLLALLMNTSLFLGENENWELGTVNRKVGRGRWVERPEKYSKEMLIGC